MKFLITTLSLFLVLDVFSQENAFDYMVPITQSNRYYNQANSSYINGDITTMETSYLGVSKSVNSVYKSDGTVGYKFIAYEDDYLSPDEDYAYFLNFNGSTASLYGHSKYVKKDGFISTYVVNETYTDYTPFTFLKVPAESYQTTDWTYKNPETGMEVSATASYKTITFGGTDRKALLVERKENGSTKREYYVKYFGLVAFDFKGYLYIASFRDYNLFSNSFIDAKTETERRSYAWSIIRGITKLTTSDSFMLYGNKDRKITMARLDSLQGLFQHMVMKNPEMINAYRYIMCVYLQSTFDKMYYSMRVNNTFNYYYQDVIDWFNTYYLIRPYPDFISKSNLSSYVTNVNDNFYYQYWETELMYLKIIISESDFEDSYIKFLYAPRIYCIDKNSSTLSNKDKCLLNSYVAIYYSLSGDVANQYKYLVTSMENYKDLSSADKDINIEYMRTVMKNLSTLKPGSEEDLIRAIKGAINLNDFNNAVKIADNGYKKSIGMSMNFAFAYASAAYGDEVNKEHLRIAMNMLKDKLESMTSSQLTDYIKYCRAMSPEYDCNKAESLYEKKAKKEKKENKSKSSSSSYSSSSRKVNFALMANPFAGLNISGNGGFFKYLPMSATLRTKSVLHEVRYNPFFGFDAKNRFIAGKITESDVSLNSGWKNIKGYDVSYAILFGKSDVSSYKKTVTSTGGGITLLYGNFKTDDETVTATIDNINTNLILRPEIKRYEGLFTFNITTMSWSNHLAFTAYYGFGAGLRTLTYGNYTFSQEKLSDPDATKFNDKRWVQSNWSGPYFTARAGFRFGITLF